MKIENLTDIAAEKLFLLPINLEREDEKSDTYNFESPSAYNLLLKQPLVVKALSEKNVRTQFLNVTIKEELKNIIRIKNPDLQLPIFLGEFELIIKQKLICDQSTTTIHTDNLGKKLVLNLILSLALAGYVVETDLSLSSTTKKLHNSVDYLTTFNNSPLCPVLNVNEKELEVIDYLLIENETHLLEEIYELNLAVPRINSFTRLKQLKKWQEITLIPDLEKNGFEPIRYRCINNKKGQELVNPNNTGLFYDSQVIETLFEEKIAKETNKKQFALNDRQILFWLLSENPIDFKKTFAASLLAYYNFTPQLATESNKKQTTWNLYKKKTLVGTITNGFRNNKHFLLVKILLF